VAAGEVEGLTELEGDAVALGVPVAAPVGVTDAVFDVDTVCDSVPEAVPEFAAEKVGDAVGDTEYVAESVANEAVGEVDRVGDTEAVVHGDVVGLEGPVPLALEDTEGVAEVELLGLVVSL
jgi:hypothetical protein